jgi:hypothetical protein
VSSQLPLPDQLVAIRGKIAMLKIEEAALRNILLTDPSTRIGADYIATVKEMTQYRVRGKELEKADPELFAKLATEVTATQVWLTKRDKD